MRKNIAKVIQAFEAGGTHTEKTCRTDGRSVWSYNMLIAFKGTGSKSDIVYVIDRTEAPSNTTRGQIDAIRNNVADVVTLSGRDFGAAAGDYTTGSWGAL